MHQSRTHHCQPRLTSDNPTPARYFLVLLAQRQSIPLLWIAALLLVAQVRSAAPQQPLISGPRQSEAVATDIRQPQVNAPQPLFRLARPNSVTIVPVMAPPSQPERPVRLPAVRKSARSTDLEHLTPANRYFTQAIAEHLPQYLDTDNPNPPATEPWDQSQFPPPSTLPPLPPEVYERAIDAIAAAPELLEHLPLFGEDFLASSPFLIPSAQPSTQLRLNYSGYFQATPHPINGPYTADSDQDSTFNSVSVYSETASGKNAGFIQLDVDSVGLREMTTGAKTSLLEGIGLFSLPTPMPHDRFWVSMLAGTIIPLRTAESFFKTSIPAISTGLLTQYQPSSSVMFHGTTNLTFQPGGDSVFLYGFGVSSLLHSTQIDDPSGISQAIIPTFEALWSTDVGGGNKTDTILALAPGLRFILSPEVELGALGAWHLLGSDERSVRIELRYYR